MQVDARATCRRCLNEDLRKQVSEEIDRIDFDFLPANDNNAIRSRIKTQATKAIDLAKQDPRKLFDAIVNVAPPVLFVIVPVFAVFLKLGYFNSGRYYAEHLVLAIHNHSFVFIAMILRSAFVGLGDAVQSWGHGAIDIWIAVYMYLSLLTVYGQGYVITLVKFAILSFFYFILFIFGISFAFVLGIMTL